MRWRLLSLHLREATYIPTIAYIVIIFIELVNKLPNLHKGIGQVMPRFYGSFYSQVQATYYRVVHMIGD